MGAATFEKRALGCAPAYWSDSTTRRNPMCKLCDEGNPQSHSGSRREFLKATAASGVAAAGANLFAPRRAGAHGDDPPEDHGRPDRRYLIRGSSGMSMSPKLGALPDADT